MFIIVDKERLLEIPSTHKFINDCEKRNNRFEVMAEHNTDQWKIKCEEQSCGYWVIDKDWCSVEEDYKLPMDLFEI